MIRLFISVVACLLAGFLQAQNILSFVPKDASKVTLVKGEKLHAQFDLDDMIQQDRFTNFEERFEKDIEDSWRGIFAIAAYKGHVIGLSQNANNYGYEADNDSLSIQASVFEMNNVVLFEQFIEGSFQEDVLDEKHQSGRFQYIIQAPYAVIWDRQFALFYKGSVNYQYINRNFNSEEDYYIEELSEKERNERDHQKDELKKKLLMADIDRMVSMNFEDAILSDQNFMSVINGDYDALSYQPRVLNNGLFKERRYDSYDYMGDYYEGAYEGTENEEEEEKNPLFEGNYAYQYWKFNGNTLNSKSYLKLNEKLNDHVKKITKGKLNPKFFNYIKGDEIQGFYAVTIDPVAGFNMLTDLSENLYNYIPGVGRGMKANMDILVSLIDTKKALNIIGGDMLFAVTDLNEVDVRYESFNYNQEDKTRERLIKTKKELRPEFIMMVSTGEPELISSFLENLSQKKRLINMGSYYKIKPKTKYYDVDAKDAKVDTYLALTNGIVLVSNNEELMTNHLEKGYDKSERLSKEWKAKMTGNPLRMYWDYEKSASADMTDFSTMSPIGGAFISGGMAMYDKIDMTGPIHLKDRFYIETNSVIKKDAEREAEFNIIDQITGLTGGLVNFPGME